MEKILYIEPEIGEKEIWKECEDYPAYEISNFGNVRNKKTKKVMKPNYTNVGGYAQIHFRIGVESRNGKFVFVHRLVAKAFLPEAEMKEQFMIDHIDGNRKNNYYKNLRWATPKENRANITKKRDKYISKSQEPVVLFNPNTNEIIQSFNSIYEAADSLNLSSRGIVENIHGRRPDFSVGSFMTKKKFEKNFKKI